MNIIKSITLLMILFSIMQACTIKITPEKTNGVVGEEIKVLLSVKNQHIPCPININESKISVSGATIVNQTEWNKKSTVEYEKSLTIKLTSAGKTEVNLNRSCDIKTLQTSATIEVKNNAPLDVKSTTLSIKETTLKLLTELAKLSSLNDNLKTLSQAEKNATTKKNLAGISTQLDSILKHSKKFASQCSLLLKGL